jgi:hypothetical protein
MLLSTAPASARRADDLGDRLEVVLDADAPPGNLLPALARLLRAMRDRERASAPRPERDPATN